MAVSTFEGIATGTTTAAATGFDFISAPSGGGATIITTNPFRGTQCMQLLTGSAGGICYAERTTSVGVSSSGQVYGRLRFRLPVMPPDATGMRVILIADSTGSFRAEARVTNTGALQLRNAAGTVLATATTTIAADTWYDIGLAVLVFSTTVGQIELRVWNTSTGTVTETLTSAATQNTTGAGGLNKLQVGAIRSGVNGYAVVVDDVDWATGGYPTITSTVTAAIDLTAASTLTAAGDVTAVGAVALSASTSLTAGAVVDRPASVSLSAASGLTAAATAVTSAAVALAAASDLTASGQVTAPAAAALSAATSLIAEAVRQTTSTVALTATTALTAATTGQGSASADLAAAATLTAGSTRVIPSLVDLTAAASLTAGPVRQTTGGVLLSAASSLTADATRVTDAVVVLSAAADLTTNSVAEASGQVQLAANSTLTATATTGHPAGTPARGTLTIPRSRSRVAQPVRRVVIR